MAEEGDLPGLPPTVSAQDALPKKKVRERRSRDKRNLPEKKDHKRRFGHEWNKEARRAGYKLVEHEQAYLAEQWSQTDNTGEPRRSGKAGTTWADHRRELAKDTIHGDLGNPPPGVEQNATAAAESKTIPQHQNEKLVWTGIGLSGGGIRSATFCLGVLQAFAAHNLLRHFDYLSTVSGGGYLGASLRWWWIGKGAAPPPDRCGVGPDDFPFGSKDPVREKRLPRGNYRGEATEKQLTRLRYLRSHGNYLAPGDGITFWSGLAAVIRSMMLNLFVWISVGTIAFLILLWLSGRWAPCFGFLPNPLPGIANPAWLSPPDETAGATPGVFSCLLALESSRVSEFWPGIDKYTNQPLPVAFALLIWLAYGLTLLFALWAMIYSLISTNSHDSGRTRPTNWWRIGNALLWLIFGCAAVFLLFGLRSSRDAGTIFYSSVGVLCLFIGLALAVDLILWIRHREEDIDDGYYARRLFESFFGWFFVKFLLIALIGAVPVIASYLWDPASTGVISIVAGIVAAGRSHYANMRKLAGGIADSIFLPLGGALFLFGVVIVSYQMALFIYDPVFLLTTDYKAGDGEIVRFVLFSAAIVGTALSLVVNTNHTGLHRYYRDRLIEAFMPSDKSVEKGKTMASGEADAMTLAETWPQTDVASSEFPNRYDIPYPIINTNVILVNDRDRRTATRGGDNYILTPLYCGSSSTGWVRTNSKSFKRMTLASAMAASGAAVNSNSGYVGGGLTRNQLISIVMSLLNVRLGYWVTNPGSKNPRYNPDHWFPGFTYAITSNGHHRDSGFLELSDGGHFENLGLYELIRRKCRVIVICDGEADKQTAYLAFVSAVRRIEEDFDATIEFVKGDDQGPQRLVASEAMSYPVDAKRSPHSYLVAKINYQDGTHGVILYLKSAIIKDLSFKVKGYKGANPDFPNETTADQFFDPIQFESYREVGYRAARVMIDELKLTDDNICNWKEIWERAHEPPAETT